MTVDYESQSCFDLKVAWHSPWVGLHKKESKQQNPLQYCKVISLQLIKKGGGESKQCHEAVMSFRGTCDAVTVYGLFLIITCNIS